MVAPAGRLDPPDTVCLAVTAAAGKKTLAHPGRATTVNGLASIALVDASSSLPIDFSAVRAAVGRLHGCRGIRADGERHKVGFRSLSGPGMQDSV